MKDFYDITVAVCTEKNPTARLILPLTGKVLRKCEIREDFSKQLKRAISENLKKRYQGEDVREYLLKCTALDPRTKPRVIVPETTRNELTDEVVNLMVSRIF